MLRRHQCLPDRGEKKWRQQPIQTSEGMRLTEEESDELVPNRNSTGSMIWQWFGFHKKNVEQNVIIFKKCHKTIFVKGKSTMNLFYHLKSHPLQNEECFKLRISSSPHTPKKMLNVFILNYSILSLKVLLALL